MASWRKTSEDKNLGNNLHYILQGGAPGHDSVQLVQITPKNYGFCWWYIELVNGIINQQT